MSYRELTVERNMADDWELRVDGEVLSVVYGLHDLDHALDAFAANHPNLAEGLDALHAEGWSTARRVVPGASGDSGRGNSGPKKPQGSGARFRELFDEGRSNAEALATVREEFAESKATLSDAAFNRAIWKKGRA